jgi:nucleoside-diphosphate-sugar epimerase
MSTRKPEVLVLGGLGFIGRNVVKYLVDNKVASFIRVADKTVRSAANLHDDHKAAFESELVHYKQADLSRERHARACMADHDFDYVINCCGETRAAMKELDFKQKCLDAATTVAGVAAEKKITKWVEISHGWIYSSDSRAKAEDGKIAPWTVQGSFRYQAEEALRKIDGLPLVTLRPAYVYGPGDLMSLAPRICCAVHYAHARKKMEFLWGSSLKLNTVHIDDVCAAIWHACTTLEAGTIYNLADSGDTTAGKINTILGRLFGCSTGFRSSLVSRAASVNLQYAAEHANNQHIPGWRDVCMESKISNTPLTPYIDAELLSNSNMSINGTAITQTGFTYQHPTCTEDLVRAQVQFHIDQGIFPPVMKA